MKRLLLSCVSAAMLLTASSAAAQDIDQRKCLQCDITLKTTTKLLKVCYKKTDSLDRQIKLLTSSLEASTERAALQTAQINDFERVNMVLQNEVGVWYRNPAIVGSLGVAVGAAATVAFIVAVK